MFPPAALRLLLKKADPEAGKSCDLGPYIGECFEILGVIRVCLWNRQRDLLSSPSIFASNVPSSDTPRFALIWCSIRTSSGSSAVASCRVRTTSVNELSPVWFSGKYSVGATGASSALRIRR